MECQGDRNKWSSSAARRCCARQATAFEHSFLCLVLWSNLFIVVILPENEPLCEGQKRNDGSTA